MGNILYKLADGLETLHRGWSEMFGRSVGAYCDLEAGDPESPILISRDGTCVTLLEWRGATKLVGSEEYETIIERMKSSLAGSLQEPGHAIQLTFGCDRNPEMNERLIRDQMANMRSAADKLQLSLDDLLEDRVSALAEHCAYEYCYVALSTNRNFIPSAEWKSVNDAHRKATRDIPKGKRAQDMTLGVQAVIDVHNSFVDNFVNDMKVCDMQVRVLESREACRTLRSLVDAEFTDDKWSPLLPGDDYPRPENAFKDDKDFSELMWPPLAEQLVPRDPVILDKRTVEVGDRLWGCVTVDKFQQTAMPFPKLFNRMRTIGQPWRVSISISGNGLGQTGLNRQMSSLLSIAGAINTRISDAFKTLENDRLSGGCIVALRMVAGTWVRSNEKAKLSESTSRLARAIQGWGECDVGDVSGNPAASFFSMIPGMRLTSVAPPANCHLERALELLPWHRPCSPWDIGNFLLRTPDGKPYPYAAYSSMQAAWIALFMSPMGGGKSNTLNSYNLGLILDPSNDYLPLIRILDIGPSSSGLTSLIAAALPPDRQHEAQYHRIQNTAEYAFNPCDTLLGQRQPLPAQRDFLIGLICLLATEVGQDAPPGAVTGIAQQVVDMAYERFADKATSMPRTYAPNSSLVVDEAIKKHGIHVDSRTTWWELEDQFMDLDDLRAAYNAHRYAMPLISDMAVLAMDQAITKVYSDKTNGGLNICEWFRRTLLESISQYKILSGPTKFDLGDASIISLDLDEVARRGNPVAQRQTTVMYMLSLWLLSSDFFLGIETLPQINAKYRPYHEKRITRLLRAKKRLCADEFHRPAESSKQAVEMITQMIREGRKWRVDLCLASQRADDFSKSIVDLTTAVFIMKPPLSGAVSMREQFQLSPTAEYIIDTQLLGPRPGHGANMYLQLETKDGRQSQLVTNTAGAVELWAFSTTADDRDVRDTLYRKLTPGRTRALLAKRFPGGSCVSEIQRRQKERIDNGVTSDKSVTDEIIEEILELDQKMQVQGL